MIIKSAEFVTSAVKPDQYPAPDMPEIAFVGRSNVGKSSLINVLVNRKGLVKTSNTPGRTQLVNFFRVNDAMILVDLPGYGYARVPKAIKKSWGPLVETYFKRRDNLKGAVLLMDIRRMPRPEETSLVEWLWQLHIPSLLVLTKADKFSRSQQIQQRVTIAKTLGIDIDSLILFSAKTRMGRAAVWEAIEKLL